MADAASLPMMLELLGCNGPEPASESCDKFSGREIALLYSGVGPVYRTLRDGSFEGRFPRHFVPGYDRLSLRGLSDFGHFEKGDALKCPYTRF